MAPGSSVSRYQHSWPHADLNVPCSSAALFRAADSAKCMQPLETDLVVPIEFNGYHRGIDPFEAHDDKTQVPLSRRRRRLFARLSAVAGQAFAMQHRVSLFMLFIVGRRFRFLRWDRAGVITTPSIDYYENAQLLLDMIGRAFRLTDEALGLDPSATRLHPTDVDFLRMDVASLYSPTDISHAERNLEECECQGSYTFEYVRSLFRSSLRGDWPRYRLQIVDGSGSRSFLVGEPIFCAGDMVGRGTRGYVALDCRTGRFVWLKDVWRASFVISETEGDVLHKLNCAGIENVPTLVCHGDICEQRTFTGDFWEQRRQLLSSPVHQLLSSPSLTASIHTIPPASPCRKKRKRPEGTQFVGSPSCGRATADPDCPLREHRHYRIVVEEVCMPLKNFQCGRQLLSIVLDCLRGESHLHKYRRILLTGFDKAHHQAATSPQTQLLHRDISGGNILIYPKVICDKNGRHASLVWSGILSDWELSKPVGTQEATTRATQAERMVCVQTTSVTKQSPI